jgi:1,2-diacylglycerol 3-alpha-glucosyltransferase
MNILMVSDVYFPRINGVSTSVQTFQQELARLGHRVALIAPDYGTAAGDDADIIRVPSRYMALDPEDRMLKAGEVLKIKESLRAQRFDLLHIQTPFVAHYLGIKLARALSIPRVETYHTFFEEYLFHYVPFLPKAVMRFMARRFSAHQCNAVDALVVPSRAMLEVLRAYGVRSQAAIIPTGISLEKFRAGDGAAFRERYGIEAERPTLVHVGRVAFEKNIDFLLQVLDRVRQELPDVLLIIAGEGPAEGRLRATAWQLGLERNVLWVGYLSRAEELLDCYSAGDVFVFASRTETQGLVLLEAMALGVPVVSTAVMGTRDLLDAGRGALVAEEDASDFSAKVVRLLRDRGLRERLSAEGRECAQDWSARRMAAHMAEFYQEVIARRLVDRRRQRGPNQV